MYSYFVLNSFVLNFASPLANNRQPDEHHNYKSVKNIRYMYAWCLKRKKNYFCGGKYFFDV